MISAEAFAQVPADSESIGGEAAATTATATTATATTATATTAAATTAAVTTIGTCRIADPIAAAARNSLLHRNITDLYGFVHTSKEILQQIDVFDGREFPAELVRFISSADYEPHRERGRTDLFLVEVSSLKEVHFSGHLLQINCLDRIFRSRRGLWDAFFQHQYAADRAARAERLLQVADFADADPIEQRVLLEGYVQRTTREELDRDLQTILARLPAPVVFVCHIDVLDSTGQVIAARSRLCAWMREICAERGYALFDPAPHVLAYGRALALAEEGRDANHYTPEYKPVLGALLFETFVKPLAPAQSATEETPAPAVEAPAMEAQAVEAPAETPAPTAVEPPVPTSAAPGAAPVPAAVPASASADLRALLADAKASIGRGDMDEADVLLRTAAIDHPGAAEVYTLLGTVAFHRGDSTGALADLRHAMQVDPSAIEPKIMLVKIAQRLNRLEEACTQALDLVASVPNDHKALTVAAKALTKAKRFQQAAGVWRRVAMLREHQAGPLTEAARCELKGRNYDDAVKVADAALAREPDEIGALVIKAEALQRTKRMKELAAVVLRIALVDPTAAMASVPPMIASSHHEEAAAIIAAVRGQGHQAASDSVMQAGLLRTLTQRARRAVERQDSVAAAAAWRAVDLLDPGNRRAASGMRKLVAPVLVEARRLLAAGEFAPAIAECRRGLGFDPDNARLQRELAVLQERTADWFGAVQSWEALAQQSAEPTPPLLRAARAAGRAERPDEALRIYAQLDPVTRAEVGSRVLSLTRKLVRSMRDDFAEGRLDESVHKARLLLLVDPASAPAANLFRKAASSYRRLVKGAVVDGNVARQEEVCRKLLQIDPNRPDALKVLSRVYGGARRWREGIEVQQRLTELEPGEPRHWRKLASMCRAGRNYDMGVVAALKAVELEPGNGQSMEFLSEILNRQALAA